MTKNNANTDLNMSLFPSVSQKNVALQRFRKQRHSLDGRQYRPQHTTYCWYKSLF